jgi:pilus assembly protein CpaC
VIFKTRIPTGNLNVSGLFISLAISTCNVPAATSADGWFEVTRGSEFLKQEARWQAVHSHTGTLNPVNAVNQLRSVPAPDSSNSREATRESSRDFAPIGHARTVNIDMFIGEVKVFERVDVTRVATGNGNILRVEVLDTDELMIIAQAEGSSSVRLWHRDGRQSDYNVRVSSADPETRVREETMIRMRVRMIEFRKSALGKLGIDWSDSINGPGFAVAGDAIGNAYFRPEADAIFSELPNTVQPLSGYFGVAANITSRINFLASTGDATTLAEPVLSTMNGGSASFLAGGEVPYPSIGSNGQTVVQFKEYGIKLLVSPSIDASGLVRTVIDTEISQLDPAVSVQGAPGLLSRKAKTEVNVRSGETIVISGLLSSDSSKDIDKIPGIARLPVIGQFFRAQSARNSVNELVIFVTPEVIDAHPELITQRQQDFLGMSNRRVEAAHRLLPSMD